LLIAAHQALEALVCSHAERDFKRLVDQRWADLAYRGLWWEPLMSGLRAFANAVGSRMTGKVALQLSKGGLRVVARSSHYALYSEAAASFDDTESLDPSLMTGMVRVHGMESEIFRRVSSA
jgi:argininosuccinate synthase